jgi:tetratricopeptide (TPR) repeat protein
MIRRKFDFSLDYEVINLLGRTYFDLGLQRQRQERTDEAQAYWTQAVERFQKTLSLDPENVAAHYNLALLYRELENDELAEHHESLHTQYKSDDTAQGVAVGLARQKYPAANHAAEAVVKYPLQRPGAPGLPAVPDVSQTSEVSAE